jgi:hypothetical protein
MGAGFNCPGSHSAGGHHAHVVDVHSLGYLLCLRTSESRQDGNTDHSHLDVGSVGKKAELPPPHTVWSSVSRLNSILPVDQQTIERPSDLNLVGVPRVPRSPADQAGRGWFRAPQGFSGHAQTKARRKKAKRRPKVHREASGTRESPVAGDSPILVRRRGLNRSEPKDESELELVPIPIDDTELRRDLVLPDRYTVWREQSGDSITVRNADPGVALTHSAGCGIESQDAVRHAPARSGVRRPAPDALLPSGPPHLIQNGAYPLVAGRAEATR